MKLLLVTPPYHAGVVESAGCWMPLSLVYLAGAARDAGVEVEIYDAMTKQHSLKDMESKLATADPDYLGISTITASLPASLEVLQLAKRLKPHVTTIMGGVHPTFCDEELLEEHGDVIDFIIRGEGELTLPALLGKLIEGHDPPEVRGISFARDNAVIRTPGQPFISDLDSLRVAWDLLEWEDYQYFVIPDSRLAAISTSRGCSHECTFCSQQKFWEQTWRARSPDSVVSEMQMLKEIHGANVFLITDEYPTCDKERWELLLDLIIDRNLDIYLLMETRVEDIIRDEQILDKYRAAGIIHVYIGIEATDQETLDAIKKDASAEQSRRAIELIRKHGMISETSFVLGFPWETEQSIEHTLKLAKHYNPDFAHFLAITPWPYADMYDEVKQRIEVYDYAKYNLVEPIIRPNAMSREAVHQAIVDCYKRYYMGKVIDYFNAKDPFVREYLTRSIRLIMNNSFLTQLMQRNGATKEFSWMNKYLSDKSGQETTSGV
ncbi:radical SAM protein [Candidatus Neomarinimicrobiota bacterium]